MYRRFVSYVNFYYNNVKQKNVGFAKVEAKERQCHVEIHVNGMGEYQVGTNPVYMFVRREREILCILIGEIIVKNGRGDSVIIFDVEQVGDSTYKLEDVQGIVITLNETSFLGSEWDDKEINSQYFKIHKENLPEIVNEQQRSEHGKVQAKVLEGVQEKVKIEAKEKENLYEEAILQSAETKCTLEKAKYTVEGLLEQEEKRAWYDDYEKINPFENDNGFYVKMSLNDLKNLPEKLWFLGNNNFLLHGYNYYQYIIYGRMNINRQEKWIIGVPGIFSNQEKFVASMFGFQEFKTQKACTCNLGQFGCWIRIIS